MPDIPARERALRDPRVLSDRAVFIAMTSRRLALLADALAASRTAPVPDPARDPGTDKWTRGEAGLVGRETLDAALIEGACAFDFWLASYVETVITMYHARRDRVSLDDLAAVLAGVAPLDPDAALAFVLSFPPRLRRTVAIFFPEPEPPADLEDALAQVASFAYETPAPRDDLPEIDLADEENAWLLISAVVLHQFEQGGPERVRDVLRAGLHHIPTKEENR